VPNKFTMLFNFGGSGFSETWYSNDAVPTPIPPNSKWDQLYASRFALCNNSVTAIGYRISDPDNPRLTQSRVNPGLASFGDPPEPVQQAWLATVRGQANVGRRQFWMRGIADDWIQWSAASQSFTVVGPLKVAFDKFKALLLAGQWCIRTVQSLKAAGGGNPVNAISPNALGNAVTLSAAGAGIDKTKPIIVSGFKKGLGYLNGTYAALSGYQIPGNDVWIYGKSVSTTNATAYVGGGRVRQALYTYTPVADMNLEFPRERRTGRAFFVPRGRRAKRA
jgi:hypothetical protein